LAYTTQDRSKFSDRFERPEQYAGYGLCDPQGSRIGRVQKLFVNGSDEPEYIEVKMGLFGLKTALIPVTSVTIDEKRQALVLH
jgi:hypothetical protein